MFSFSKYVKAKEYSSEEEISAADFGCGVSELLEPQSPPPPGGLSLTRSPFWETQGFLDGRGHSSTMSLEHCIILGPLQPEHSLFQVAGQHLGGSYLGRKGGGEGHGNSGSLSTCQGWKIKFTCTLSFTHALTGGSPQARW